MTERWFLAKLYYSLADVRSEEDPNGDLILAHFVGPAVAHFHAQGWLRWATFMRFAEEGYHIRFMLYGDEQALSGQVEPYIQREFPALCRSFPQTGLQPMELSPLAIRLNQKWGGPKQQFRLLPPGSVVMGLTYDTGEDQIFESQQAFSANYALHADACLRILELLKPNPPYKLRKSLIRFLLDDFLRMTDLSALERYYFLTYCQLQWMDYFNIEPELLAPYYQHYRDNERRYQQHFARKQEPEDTLALLPAPLKDFYQGWLEALRQKVPPILARDQQGALTPYGSLRLLSFFHLVHNRVGIGMLQEIYLCHILAQHYRASLTPNEIAQAASWAEAMKTLTPAGLNTGQAPHDAALSADIKERV